MLGVHHRPTRKVLGNFKVAQIFKQKFFLYTFFFVINWNGFCLISLILTTNIQMTKMLPKAFEIIFAIFLYCTLSGTTGEWTAQTCIALYHFLVFTDRSQHHLKKKKIQLLFQLFIRQQRLTQMTSLLLLLLLLLWS